MKPYTVLRIRIGKQSASGHEIPESLWTQQELATRIGASFDALTDAERERDAWNEHANWHAWVIPTWALGHDGHTGPDCYCRRMSDAR